MQHAINASPVLLVHCETVEVTANVADSTLPLCAEEVFDLMTTCGELHAATHVQRYGESLGDRRPLKLLLQYGDPHVELAASC